MHTRKVYRGKQVYLADGENEIVSDCQFFLTNITGVTAKSKHTVQYPNLPSAMRSVSHIADLHVPKPPTNMTLTDSELSEADVDQANKN
jgi:hypothetical protein